VTEPELTDVGVEEEAPGGASSDAPPEEPGADDSLQRIVEAEAKRDEYLVDLQRVAADFDNYRKRVLRDQGALVARATASLVERLLPVLDDLERALDAAEHHDDAKVLEGVRMTRDALAAVLATEGLVEIEADGAFDPHSHEALMATTVEGAASGDVVEVVQRGYRLGDTVLRPARVIVAE
jgi:molecular chaperone GrpE